MRMIDLTIDFLETMVSVTANTEKGLKYLKSHWRKRPLIVNMKLVSRFKIALFKKAGLTWSILSNCKAMAFKRRERNES